ncbi:hypothetical protein [Profundibacter sp.]|uniref:hypothetical protein n=1 Tax=Profundibacter sp. TaxID=3101071 RepID=UPI003D0C3303
MFQRSRSRGVGYSLLLVASLTGCGYTPQTTLQALSKVDPNTPPEDMKIMVALPPDIRPQKKAPILKMALLANKTMPTESQSFTLERIPNGPDEIRTHQSANGFAYRLRREDVPRFKALYAKGEADDSREGSIDVDADFCHTTPEVPKQAIVTVYLKTAELHDYVPLVKNIDFMKELDPAERALGFPRCTKDIALQP